MPVEAAGLARCSLVVWEGMERAQGLLRRVWGLMKGGSLTPLAADDKGRAEPPARQHQSSIRFVVSHDSFTNILISIRRIFSGIFLFVFLC